MAKKRHAEEAPALSMTPMIDIVFNLVIFFLIVTDLTQKELENLVLPLAVKAKEDKAAEEEERVIINLVEKIDPKTKKPLGTYEAIVKRKKYTHAALKDYLLSRANTLREDTKAEGALVAPSKIFVLIRADRSTPWQEVQWIMQDCADPYVAIWKLQFATRDPSQH
jgi:biopolymer transport protein ExbD